MKFTQLFPEATPGDEPVGGLVFVDVLVGCRSCGDQTHFVYLGIRGGICSEECAVAIFAPPALDADCGPSGEERRAA